MYDMVSGGVSASFRYSAMLSANYDSKFIHALMVMLLIRSGTGSNLYDDNHDGV